MATIFALERELGAQLDPREERLRIAAEVGSDLPLFLVGGTVLGIDRGQEVYPLQDLSPMHLVVLTPPVRGLDAQGVCQLGRAGGSRG